tara:strand:- start:85817 stop:86566 length:750 start_codon:yes stop_codon:yes gene_type:complete
MSKRSFKMSNQYLMQKNLAELSRIEAILRHQPNITARSIMSTQHVKLVEEQKRLQKQIKQDSFAAGLQNPLESNQSLRDNNNYVTNNSMHNLQQNNSINTNRFAFALLANQDQQTPPERDNQVPSAERQAACEALKPNGCGGKGVLKGNWIPDFPSRFDFTQACNNHDRNYSTLGFGFDRANNVFLQDMLAVLPVKKIRHTKSGKMIEFVEKPDAVARNYYNYVTNNGRPFYDDAQRNAYICKYGKRPD